MAETKYGKYIAKNALKETRSGRLSIYAMGTEVFGGANFSIKGFYHTADFITDPFAENLKKPHKHPFDEVLIWMGPNLEDASDFDAEIHFCMGEEQELHVIDSPTVVYIPKNMTHCPLEYIKINKPVMFFEIYMAPGYERT